MYVQAALMTAHKVVAGKQCQDFLFLLSSQEPEACSVIAEVAAYPSFIKSGDLTHLELSLIHI